MKENRIGEQIKEYRLKLGLSQLELAQKAGFKNAIAISQLENGYRLPSLGDTLPKICQALGVDFEVVFTDSPQPSK